MSAATQPVPSAETVALALLATLVQLLGTEMVSLVIDAVANPTAAATQLIDDLDLLAGAVVRGVLDVIEPAAAKAAVAAGYTAAETAGDAAEAARLATLPKG